MGRERGLVVGEGRSGRAGMPALLGRKKSAGAVGPRRWCDFGLCWKVGLGRAGTYSGSLLPISKLLM